MIHGRKDQVARNKRSRQRGAILEEIRRSCIVTGPTKGLGHAISSHLIASGYEVIGVARSRPHDWIGRDFIEADLSTEAGVELITEKIRQFDSIWAVVNNVGAGSIQSLDELTGNQMMHLFWVNAVVPSLITQSACRQMRDGGRVLNMSSVASLGAPHRSSYGASKAALSSLTKTWALELAPKMITVNAIAPGPIETGMFRTFNPPGSEGEARIRAQIPLGYFGTPEEVAELAMYILSPSTRYLTGQIFYVDGGLSVGHATV